MYGFEIRKVGIRDTTQIFLVHKSIHTKDRHVQRDIVLGLLAVFLNHLDHLHHGVSSQLQILTNCKEIKGTTN